MVTIALADGKTYLVRYTLGSLRRLAWEYGIDLLSGAIPAIDAVSIGPLLYWGLRREHPEVTLDYVLDNFDTSHLTDIVLSVYADISCKTREALLAGEGKSKRKRKGQPMTVEALWAQAVYDFGVPPSEAWQLCMDEWVELQGRWLSGIERRAQELAILRNDILNQWSKKPRTVKERFPALFGEKPLTRKAEADEKAELAAKVRMWGQFFPARKRKQVEA